MGGFPDLFAQHLPLGEATGVRLGVPEASPGGIDPTDKRMGLEDFKFWIRGFVSTIKVKARSGTLVRHEPKDSLI
ncbi:MULTISPECIES: hypothetical protein [unclassified Nostoc]|uniref:hypothetical protein n=1 Tax=unclassified Nostoc TaxID=2593658 RepID=UPI002615DA64|nr:hypothetical protein [Nostoc sp. S13]MDF5735152.1 hypothetical protein [Nostoc sp. S13]